jgi:hypothetical protein
MSEEITLEDVVRVIDTNNVYYNKIGNVADFDGTMYLLLFALPPEEDDEAFNPGWYYPDQIHKEIRGEDADNYDGK